MEQRQKNRNPFFVDFDDTDYGPGGPFGNASQGLQPEPVADTQIVWDPADQKMISDMNADDQAMQSIGAQVSSETAPVDDQGMGPDCVLAVLNSFSFFPSPNLSP